MKHFRLLILCLIIVSAVTLLCSCGSDNRLDTPGNVYVDYDSLTLTWDGVEGAKIYTVCIESDGSEPQSFSVSNNSYSLGELGAGKYTITVTAMANSSEIKDSLPSRAVEFIKDVETGLAFKLINGGKEYEVSDRGDTTGVIVIPESYRMKPVTAIGANAFMNGSEITEVVLPESIKVIGDFAFANCSYLEKINLPKGLTELGESAFSGCRALSGRIELPVNLNMIPEGAFAYCLSLEEISFGPKLTSIAKNAFTDCSGLQALTFPESLRVIDTFAFAACTGIKTVSFNQGIEIIGDFAFSKAIALTSVAFPSSLRSVGEGAFYYCTALSVVELGDGIESIGQSAFLDTAIYNNSSTNEIYIDDWFIGLKYDGSLRVEIKEGTKGIANNAFYGNQYLQSIELPESVERIGSLAFAKSKIVSIVTGSGVKHIADQAFLSCDKLTIALLGSYDYVSGSIESSSLESIGNYAFMNCSMLERIEIPDTVKDIGSYAFRNSGIYNAAVTGLVYVGTANKWLVDFNNNVQSEISVDPGTVGIARYALYNCRTITDVALPNSVKVIGRGAFYSCTALESIILPDTLERIEDYTFYSCNNLRLTSLPPMLKEIGRSAFYMCGTVKNYDTDTENDILQLPSGVTHIGDYAFYGCGYRQADGMDGETETGGIDVLIIGDQVEYIGKCAFYGFASLKNVTVGGAVYIGEKAFYMCPSLEEVSVLDKLESIGNKAFYKCDSLKKVSLPDTLKTIGDYTFFNCESLTEAYVGEGVESIGDFAFSGDKALCSIYLPASVKRIGAQAFRDCDSIGSVSIGKSVEYIGEHAFYSCDSLTVYAEHISAPSEWSSRWNSSFVPVVWGCEMTDNHVVFVTVGDNHIANNFMNTALSAPSWRGYIFLGWSSDPTSGEAEFSCGEIADLDENMKVYSVWTTLVQN